MTAPRLLFVTPAWPADTGNGLAMRAATTLRSLATIGPVTAVVVPDVPASPGDLELLDRLAARVVVHEPRAPEPSDATSWMADAASRARLAARQPLAAAVAAATPRAVDALAQRVRSGEEGPFDLVVALRLRSVPWIEPFLGEATSVVDLDDDEVATQSALAAELARRGDADGANALQEQAEALGRLADDALPAVDLVLVASPDDVAAVCRHGAASVEAAPNAVPIPDGPSPWGARRAAGAGRARRLVFVGNLRYLPNVWGVEWLVDDVLPRLRAAVPDVQVDVVGAGAEAVRALDAPGVRVHGWLASLEGVYASADVAVVPVAVGGGTRVKLLEAAAHGVPVVSTSRGSAGLGLVDGEHLLVADDAAGFAAACARVLVDDAGQVLVAKGRRVVAERFAAPVVEARLAARLAALVGATDR